VNTGAVTGRTAAAITAISAATIGEAGATRITVANRFFRSLLSPLAKRIRQGYGPLTHGNR